MHSRQIAQWTVHLQCDDPGLADGVFALLEEVVANGQPLEDGKTIQAGWSTLILKASTDGFHVLTANIRPDGALALGPELTGSLTVTRAQMHVAARTGIAPQDTNDRQYVAIAKGVLDHHAVVLQRQEAQFEGDSGWRIRSAESHEPPDYEAVPSYQLLAQRPSLLSALAIPTDYMVVFEGKRIDAILDPYDRNLW